jgi:hypothetical protein
VYSNPPLSPTVTVPCAGAGSVAMTIELVNNPWSLASTPGAATLSVGDPTRFE